MLLVDPGDARNGPAAEVLPVNLGDARDGPAMIKSGFKGNV